MFYSDYHIHTKHSFDYQTPLLGSVKNIAQICYEKGLNEIALTDHHELIFSSKGRFPAVDFNALFSEVQKQKDFYNGKLNVLYGVELGQILEAMDTADTFLRRHCFDFVIGSVHTIRNGEDFYYLDFSSYTEEELWVIWENYVLDNIQLARWGKGKISTIGHFTYPYRYYKKNGFGPIIENFKKTQLYDEFLNEVIENDIALEINTSGFRYGLNDSSPSFDLVKRYIQMGGKLITVGSDSHNLRNCGDSIKDVYEFLVENGLKYIARFNKMKISFEKII